MRRVKDKIEGSITNADYATSAGSASKATSADSATKATTADKLGTSAGSTTQPVYFKDGKPTVIGYTIAKSVPPDAKFTDTNTTYSNMGGASTSSAGKAGLVPAPAAGAANRYLRSDGTWQVPPDTNTWRPVVNNLTSTATDQSLSAAQGKALKTLVDGKAPASHTHDDRYYTEAETDKNFHKRLGDIPGGDFDNAIVEGIYQYHSGNKNAHPGNDHGTLQVFNNHYNSAANGSDYVYQIAYPVWGQHPWMRTRTDGSTWTDWVQIFTTDGGEMGSNIGWNKKSFGPYWYTENGDCYHLRPDSWSNLFQLVKVPHDGSSPYGVINVYDSGQLDLSSPNGYIRFWLGNAEYSMQSDGLHAPLKGNADTASRLLASGQTTLPMTFNWAGKNGQPTWLWGGDNWDNMYVYNPSNFNVNYATSAGSAATASGWSGGNATDYINFNQTSTGLAWTCANGDVYHLRPWSPNNVFQLTRQNPNGIGEYGVFNVFSDGSMSFGQPGYASANPILGTVACGSNYIRFGDGTQICWGSGSAGTDTGNGQAAGYVSFPVPFANTSYAFTSSPNGSWQQNNRLGWTGTYDRGTTGTYVNSQGGNGGYYTWIAIGRWT